MPKLLTLSRAARLVGVSRGDLQKRIQSNEIKTFEGQVPVSELLRAYPEARLEDDSALERVRRIKELAVPSLEPKMELPSPQVLATRLTALSVELTEARTELGYYTELSEALSQRLGGLAGLAEGDLRAELASLREWFEQQRGLRPQVPRRKAELLARDTFLRMLSAQVKIIPSGHEFFVEGTVSILDAALRGGLAVRYGCSNGECGSCKCRVVSGDVLKVREHEYQISTTERNLGYVLMCSYTAVTDLVVEASEAVSAADLPRQDIQARVRHLTLANEQVAILQLQTPSRERLRFLAGQRAMLSLEDGTSAELALASCPCDGENLEFHLRRDGEDAFRSAVFGGGVQEGQSIAVSGPRGELALNKDSHAAVLLLAYDEGFAAIASLVESAISADEVEAYQLYWLVPQEGGHYMDNRCRAWRDALDNFSYTPLVVPLEAEPITARMAAELASLGDLSQRQIYVVGSALFVDSMMALFGDRGVPEAAVHGEALPI